MNNSIGLRIKKIREGKGISQEAMAMELNITQSSYGRLEKNDNRLTVPKLTKIAKVLDVSIAYLFDEKTAKVIQQQHNENAQAYNVETIINSDKEHIVSLREEIVFLKKIISSKFA